MAGTLHIVRHGEVCPLLRYSIRTLHIYVDLTTSIQALHNISDANRTILDPILTSTGSDQARALKLSFPYRDRPIIIFSSPLRRALQTALIGFDGLLKPETGKVVCFAEAQETGTSPCDTGRALDDLAQFLAEQGVADHVDLRRVPRGWDSKTGEWSERDDAVEVRAQKLLGFLAEEVERGSDVVLVTHGFFIHYLIEDWDDYAVRGNGKCESGFWSGMYEDMLI